VLVIGARFGNRLVQALGGVIALLGLCGLLLASVAWIGLVSFVFVGLGAANIVPILFRLAGTQHKMPKGLAVAALTSAGYAGMRRDQPPLKIFTGAIEFVRWAAQHYRLALATSATPRYRMTTLNRLGISKPFRSRC
jgi:phosphoglycolate phosphatase-like HAD superfamily hydrolase